MCSGLLGIRGRDRREEDAKQNAERRSSKPIDAFKNSAEPLRACKTLVVSNQNEGPCRMALRGPLTAAPRGNARRDRIRDRAH